MKQRGLKRKCRNMVRRMGGETATFPVAHPRYDFWHLHLPVARGLVNSGETPFGIRRLCAQTLIARAHHLTKLAPDGEDVRVVVALVLPDVWASQIIVFFEPRYFENFFNRNNETQTWTSTTGRLSRQWNLALPPTFREAGFDQEVREEDGVRHGQIWFFGQL